LCSSTRRKRLWSKLKQTTLLLLGQEKRHTLKTQLVIDKATGTIICLAHAAGRRHDFRVLKDSGVRLHSDTQAITDTCYMGLQKLHSNTTMPKKRSKNNPLNKEDKRHNRTISKAHVPAEPVIACVKRFKIVSDRDSNRRKRFGLRVTLMAAAYNKDLMP